jgi:hypothetical protein
MSASHAREVWESAAQARVMWGTPEAPNAESFPKSSRAHPFHDETQSFDIHDEAS